jgi:hypothetical protein
MTHSSWRSDEAIQTELLKGFVWTSSVGECEAFLRPLVAMTGEILARRDRRHRSQHNHYVAYHLSVITRIDLTLLRP